VISVPAATHQRRLLVTTAIALYGLVFVAFVAFEMPGLGLGHFFYIPVALVALACGTRGGLAAGLVATALYALAIVVTPRLPTGDVIQAATLIRLLTYTSCGALVGWFANEHARHLAQLRDLAERDFLTNLLNTRMFDEALAQRCAASRPFLLLLGDMDNLKEINDTHGHQAGNNELRRLADALQHALGPGDQLARIGGDEFAILKDGRVEDVAEICMRLRKTLEAQDLHMTFGCAVSPDDGLGPIELFRKADDRLYAAKLIQRNHSAIARLAATAQW
jgi:diguanylate cyclase (GGDEF)-like protein